MQLTWLDATLLTTVSGEEGVEVIDQERPDIMLLHPDFTDLTLGESIQAIRRIKNLEMDVCVPTPQA